MHAIGRTRRLRDRNASKGGEVGEVGGMFNCRRGEEILADRPLTEQNEAKLFQTYFPFQRRVSMSGTNLGT